MTPGLHHYLIVSALLFRLGLLGVVVRVRLRAVPAFHLCVREGPEDLDELLRSLPARIASARFCAWSRPNGAAPRL